jgi:hypothetical protein
MIGMIFFSNSLWRICKTTMWTNTSDFFLTKKIISFKERVGRFWEMCFPNVNSNNLLYFGGKSPKCSYYGIEKRTLTTMTS